MTALLSPQQAMIYVMVTASAADRAMNDREIATIADIVRSLPVFIGFDAGRIPNTAQSCSELLQAEEGLDAIVGMVTGALPATLHETAYALAVEVIAADGRVRQEELVFLEMLEDAFALDKLIVAAIERSARVRYRRPPAEGV
jgi:uncharacterized membrane protein YebE (DUF533 family)